MPFGLHNRLSRAATYVTVLRDPVERAISEYYFALTYRLHPEHRMIRRLSLEEYIRTTPYGNVQTRLLGGGDSSYDFLSGECTAETLEFARRNLSEHFAVVGLTERFDETLALAKVILGWKIDRYLHFNVTKGRPPTDHISVSARDLIAERYCYDIELNEYAKRLFGEAVSRHACAVERELRNLRGAKRLGRAQAAYYRGASAIRQGISRVYSAL